MIDDRQVEAAARALHEHVSNWSGRARSWELTPRVLQDRFRDEARAALTAAAQAAPSW